MQNRLSLADLKAKANTAVIKNAEIYTGGEAGGCHYQAAEMKRDGVVVQPMIPRT